MWFWGLLILYEKKWNSASITGIDISGDLLNEGKHQYPSIKLFKADLFDLNPKPQSYDYVILSGVLNRKSMGNNGPESAREYGYNVIKRMFDSSKIAIAFNLLDARHEWTAGRWDLQNFYPDDIKEFIEGFT